MGPKRNIYAIYASQDKELVHTLLRHFQLLEKDFNVSIWHDKPIYPDQQWKPQNVSRLHEADIFLLLVSNAFMYSPFIQQSEFKMVIDKYKDGKATVTPILLDDCPWDTEFNSDDYDFSFKELQLLPEDRKPMRNWDALDDAVQHVTDQVKRIVASSSEEFDSELPNEILEPKAANGIKATQTVLDLAEDSTLNSADEQEKRGKEKAETKKIAEEEKRLREEAEIKRKAIEKQKLTDVAEAKRKTEQELKRKEEAEAKKGVEEEKSREKSKAKRKAVEEKVAIEKAEAKKLIKEEQKLAEEAEAKRIAFEERNRREEAEAKKREEQKQLKAEAQAEKKAAEEHRLKEAAEAKRIALEEKQRLKEESEVKKAAEQELKLKEVTPARERSEKEYRQDDEVHRMKATRRERLNKIIQNSEERIPEETESHPSRKKVYIGLGIGALVILGIWVFSLRSPNPEKSLPTLPNTNTTTNQDSIAASESIIDAVAEGESVAKLAVGDSYKGGLIFAIDQSGKTGKIAHSKDAGPMPWENANAIHEQLGEGWRLPTLTELRLMYRTIGQGATNSGQFADELYWSATPFDTYQARLLRFRDGNGSYHFNKAVANRKFLVRAVRDF